MIAVLNIVIVTTEVLILLLVGFGLGTLRQRARSLSALKAMENKVMPITPVLGIGAVFLHGYWLKIGDPPRRLARKHGLAECVDCGHWGNGSSANAHVGEHK